MKVISSSDIFKITGGMNDSGGASGASSTKQTRRGKRSIVRNKRSIGSSTRATASQMCSALSNKGSVKVSTTIDTGFVKVTGSVTANCKDL